MRVSYAIPSHVIRNDFYINVHDISLNIQAKLQFMYKNIYLHNRELPFEGLSTA